MKSNLLYPLLVVGVLTFGACSGESRDPAAVQPPVSDQENRSGAELSGNERSQTANESTLRILFLGDSITAGLGVETEQSFPALLQTRIDSMDYPAHAINAGLSGETSSGGLSRLSWLLREPVDILFLELGGNDGLRGINLDVTTKNLSRIIEATRERYPGVPVILAGMQIPPNLGHEYTAAFKRIYSDVAEKHGAVFVPFAPDGLGDMKELLLPDGIHPNIAGHQALADLIWKSLEPIIISRLAGAPAGR